MATTIEQIEADIRTACSAGFPVPWPCRDASEIGCTSTNMAMLCFAHIPARAYCEEPAYTEWGMRYTKIALLTFGLGLVLGLAVVAADIKSLGRVASGAMVIGITTIPVGILVDLRRAVNRRSRIPRRARTPARRAMPAARRSGKSAAPKR